jgi:hypothetical protein
MLVIYKFVIGLKLMMNEKQICAGNLGDIRGSRWGSAKNNKH